MFYCRFDFFIVVKNIKIFRHVFEAKIIIFVPVLIVMNVEKNLDIE